MARSFKEAQSYMGVLISVMMLPALLSSLYPIADRVWIYPVPVIGQYLLLTAYLGGRGPGILPFALSLGALHHLPATRVSIVAMVEVVLASIVAWVWLEETLSAAQLAGGAVVLTGIVLAQTSR